MSLVVGNASSSQTGRIILLHHLPLRHNHGSVRSGALTVSDLSKWKHIVMLGPHRLSTYYVDIVLCLHIIEWNILWSS